MRLTVERLRTWILFLGALLIAVVLLFFGFARWRLRRIGHDLPAKLGIQIQESTNGYTYSKSERGHTILTLHAAKAVQFRGGNHAELHDVSITLYGPDGAPSDRIYGNDFDYDPVLGIAHARGQVQIDLQATPGVGKEGAKPVTDDDSSYGKNTIHVKTSDLIFNQSSGLATTSQKIEFRLTEAAGSAVGASFDSTSGLLLLGSNVQFNSSVNGNPLEVRAEHGQFDRGRKQLFLTRSAVDYGDDTGSADESTVYFRADGSAYRLESHGHVKIFGQDGQKISAENAHATLGANSQPEQITLDGGLLCTDEGPLRSLHTSSSSGTLLFGAQQQLRRLQLREAVSVVDLEKAAPGPSPAGAPGLSTRRVDAASMDVDFTSGPTRKPVAQHVLAQGGARIAIHSDSPRQGSQDTFVAGDRLFATLTGGQAVSSLRGDGHTELIVVSANGARQSSRGDTLLLNFAPAPVEATKTNAAASHGKEQIPAATTGSQLQSAVQQGNVVMTQSPAKASGSPAAARAGSSPLLPAHGLRPDAGSQASATAARLTYDAASQTVRLFGNPRMRDESGELAAQTIEFDRSTGNATAIGEVQATLRQEAGRGAIALPGAGASPGQADQPIHVVADRAHLDRKQDLTSFYGKGRGDARLWQGGNLIAAPVLEISQTQQTLGAHGANGPSAGSVTAVFSGAEQKPARGAKPVPPGLQSSTVHLTSGSLLYSDTLHKAVFAHGVTAHSGFGTLHSDSMSIYFLSSQPDASKRTGGPQEAGSPGGQIERIVASGDVVVEQPDRKATGEQLVYTAKDGNYVLTGGAASPPHLTDEVHGVLTGASLLFNDRDDSVVVSGGSKTAVTETHVAK